MKIMRATPYLKAIADEIPFSVLSEMAAVQVGDEDTPAEVAALLKIEGDKKGKDCAVMFELGVQIVYLLGTIAEVESQLEDMR